MLATLDGHGKLVWRSLGEAPRATALPPVNKLDSVPLGSLWKLWVYLYLQDKQMPEQSYPCQPSGKQQGDEYCCDKAEKLDRHTALVRSCGRYFAPQRLHITADAWRQHWQRQQPQRVWLHDLNNMAPQTQVPVREILMALQDTPRPLMQQARVALLGRLLQPQWQSVLTTMGSAYRFKTFTWHYPGHPKSWIGGSAGWLPNGTPFWIGGDGSSLNVMQRAASNLSAALPVQASAPGQSCVAVNFLQRYPIVKVTQRHGDKPLYGNLRGDLVAWLENGRQLPFTADGSVWLERNAQQARIYGRFDMEAYVARVVDREGNARDTQAARALAIAARSYVLQNGRFESGCWQIGDDSRTQRVSLSLPSQTAQQIAAFTEGLTLAGSPIRYHLDRAGHNVMSWRSAQAAGLSGKDYVSILRAAYPQASWQLPLAKSGQAQQQCQALEPARAYLLAEEKRRRASLKRIAGYEPLPNHFRVCALSYGLPYSDQQQLTIYVRDWHNQQGRISLWHEYLHLALRFHPNGLDERLIERHATAIANRTLQP